MLDDGPLRNPVVTTRLLASYFIPTFGIIACLLSLSAAEQPDRFQWGEETRGFRLGVASPPAKVVAGEPMDCLLRFENVSGDSVLLTCRHGFDTDYVGIDAVGPDKEKMVLTAYQESVGKHSGPDSKILDVIKRGESREVHVRINRMIDTSRAGKYTVHLSVNGVGGGSIVSVPAPALEVDVADPDFSARE